MQNFYREVCMYTYGESLQISQWSSFYLNTLYHPPLAKNCMFSCWTISVKSLEILEVESHSLIYDSTCRAQSQDLQISHWSPFREKNIPFSTLFKLYFMGLSHVLVIKPGIYNTDKDIVCLPVARHLILKGYFFPYMIRSTLYWTVRIWKSISIYWHAIRTIYHVYYVAIMLF